MARLNYLKTGYAVADETINRSSVTALKLAHDLIMALGFEVWTGAGKTGTQLTLTTDFVLSSEDTRYTADVGSTVYTKLAIVNGTYLNDDLYVTYTTNGDYASLENIQELIDTEPSATKTTIADTDTVMGNDNTDGGKRKKWTWATVKAWVLSIMSGYGLGSNSLTLYTGNVNSLTTCGFFRVAGGQTNGAYGGYPFALSVNAVTSGTTIQTAHVNTGSSVNSIRIRTQYSTGNWTEWSEVWAGGASGSDGNGGQPPAPKPSTTWAGTPAGGWSGVATGTTPASAGKYAVVAFKTGLFCGAMANVPNSTDVNGVSYFNTTGINGLLAWRVE
jgi:hypothetical protein